MTIEEIQEEFALRMSNALDAITQADQGIDSSQERKLLRYHAVTDHLTGLYNLRGLEQRAHEEIERAKRHQRSLAMLFIDIDDFKSFNDRYGHEIGDDILRAVAEAIQTETRDGVDVLSRLHGDEFAVLLPETEAAQADLIGRRIQKTLLLQVPAYSISLSIGVHAEPLRQGSPATFLTFKISADGAMYAAKI